MPVFTEKRVRTREITTEKGEKTPVGTHGSGKAEKTGLLVA